MCYNPLQIIDYLNNKLKGISNEGVDDFIPYYEGFKGTISKITEAKFLIKGVYEKVGTDKIRVVELPVGHWTEDLKELLEGLIETKVDKDGKQTTKKSNSSLIPLPADKAITIKPHQFILIRQQFIVQSS